MKSLSALRREGPDFLTAESRYGRRSQRTRRSDQRLLKSDVKYRFSIDMASLKPE